MIRLALGLALIPTAAFTLFSAAQILGRVTIQTPSAWPFTAGVLAALGLWFLGFAAVEGRRGLVGRCLSLVRWLYVFGHEMTHALAAWSLGAEVHGMAVRADGGHVDLSRSGVFISLAPYCVPIYSILVVIAYRILMWCYPGRFGLGWFLGLMGFTLAGHLLMTGECLWQRRQPDLAAAGGMVFSLSVIAIANGLAVMLLAKALFPRAVGLAAALRQVAVWSAAFWSWSWRALKTLLWPIKAGYPG